MSTDNDFRSVRKIIYMMISVALAENQDWKVRECYNALITLDSLQEEFVLLLVEKEDRE